MARRRTIALLAGLVLLSGLSVVGGAMIDAPPTLTVENDDNTTYRVTAYTAENRETALLMNFAVTTEDGERRLTMLSQLVWPEGFRNATLVDDGIPTQQITVEPGDEVTTTVDGWTPGNVTVYLVEDLDDNETHVQTTIKSCTRRQQEHSLTLEEDGAAGSSTCASNIGLLLP
ncbi:hypothetical protein C488_07587 [Natrinema pellirubrum DSM 15624]|uniref:Uncharacterized protein n=1 Tax=Natrinema pellirubrum (strain DSM 15624 / CIP 106293 / JCM 10476 / NCIMB 786 / 157) TaxID=797303 RepID=L0JP49_NATP1|nr:hypothetical protein [Natrinema pellirubrum]AGB32141.1 hypothetical protein Natpe_2323 [Natrinema pellirubrum DSM 15624]ELY76973.1 hypothetical protein C488_07587 [Natrinema pellirubrum DSM 15624]